MNRVEEAHFDCGTNTVTEQLSGIFALGATTTLMTSEGGWFIAD